MRPPYTEYIQKHIKEYLPSEYQECDVLIRDIVKSNHVHLTGLQIFETDTSSYQESPVFYLEEYRDRVEQGESLETIMKEIAGDYINYRLENSEPPVSLDFSNYESVRDHLIMRLCDPETSNDLLAGVPWTSCGELAVLYRVRIPFPERPRDVRSADITNEIANLWGVTPEQLHKDATIAENKHNPVRLYSAHHMLLALLTGERHDLYESGSIPSELMDSHFVLTDSFELNGASVIAREGVLEKVGQMLGCDYFVVPTSIADIRIVPSPDAASRPSLAKEHGAKLASLNKMPINGPNDVLSNKVLFYDREAKTLARYGQGPMS